MRSLAIIKVWGGIGNQLFQYVFGQYLHYRYNIEVRYDNNSFISTDKLRKPELISLNSNIIFDNRCVFSRYRGIMNRMMRYFYQLNPRHHFILESSDCGDITPQFEEGHQYFFQGYWQDIKYYNWLKKNNPDFELGLAKWPEALLEYKQLIETCTPSVSIHIRRGDYFTPKQINTYGVCDKLYFENAIRLIRSELSEFKLFVFSDDINWVKANISLPNDVVIIKNYDVSQFAYIYLMSLCKHHIISNSSFSWWGAVINEQPDALVIAPKRWLLTSENTIALDKWYKIPIS